MVPSRVFSNVNFAVARSDDKNLVDGFVSLRSIAKLEQTLLPEGGFFRSGSLSLSLPAGAVKQPVDVKAHLYLDQRLMPPANTSLGEYIVSPVLVLEPHGLKFSKPIQVYFPFSVNPDGWNLFLLRAACQDPTSPQSWEEIVKYFPLTNQLETTDYDYDVIKGVLSVKHFCNHTWIGRVINRWKATKEMHFSVFGYQPNPRLDSWNVTIHCHDVCKEVFEVF